MAKTLAKSTRSTRLSEILAEQPKWPLADRLLIIRRLAEKVQALHRQGQTHRAVDADHVSLDEELQPELAPPPEARGFGGEDSDPDFCPMELAGGGDLKLPVDIEPAAATLKKAGHTLDPRRIDIYQLGTLLCRLLIDESVVGYLYSAKTKAQVPTIAQPLLETALGCNASNRFRDCEQFVAALDQAVQQAQQEEVCDTSAERMAQCQQYVQRIKGTLEAAEAARGDGYVSPIDLRCLEILLLDTRICLLREQQQNEERKADSAAAAVASLRLQKLAILRSLSTFFKGDER